MFFFTLRRAAAKHLVLAALFATVSTSLRAAVPPNPDGFTGILLGEPPSEGSVSTSAGTAQVRAQGSGIGARADQGYFAYTALGTNDFDVQVRVFGFDGTALSARAGLMVRDAATNSAAMAAVLVTPGINGGQFLSRNAAEAIATATGYFPVSLPNTWLRLQRSNDVIRGLASQDGRRWTQVGRISLTLTNALLGFGVSSARTNASATAVFGEWSDATGGSEDPEPPAAEPPGPSSRRTALVITEIHYNPRGIPGDGENPDQFIELFNSDFTDKELGGHRLEAQGLRYVFPTNVVIPAGGYLVVAKDPARLRALESRLRADQAFGPWDGDLDRDADTVRLWSPFGALLLEVPYRDRAPWPMAPDGERHSLVLARPSWGEADPRAWAASQDPGGSPGRPDPTGADPRRGLRITEVSAVPRDGVPPFVEIFNAGLDPAPLDNVQVFAASGIRLSEGAMPVPSLAPGERIAVEIRPVDPVMQPRYFLRDRRTFQVLDAVAYRGPHTNGAMGRIDLNQSELRRLTVPTPGRPNAPAVRRRLVISEVMYRPISGRNDDQFLEIWNPGTEAVLLTGWRLADAVSFTFPEGRRLGPGERVVVARNAARLQLTYPSLAAGRIVGEFNGRLGSGGERVTLLDETGAVGFGFTYRSGGEWPSLADGGGSSLELLHPELDPDLGSSWAASDETGRAGWQTYEVSGRLENGTGSVTDVRLLLLDAGEALVDEVEVFAEGSTNLLSNANFEAGLGGWNPGGTHEKSGLSTLGGAGGSAQALHLRAGGRGDNGINSVRAPLRTGLRNGTNATLRLRARWLSGARDLLLRVKGNYLELPVHMEVPEDLGTPGLPNSRSIPAARPALTDLAHFPVLPAEGQPVRVTVRISGDSGNLLPVLRHRLDPSADFAEPLPMNDAGMDGDRVAGDGIYTAVLPGRGARTMAAFHVTLGSEGNEFRVPRTTVGREALVRWGEVQPAGNLGAYRIWITRATESRWSTRARLHNGDLDATFVYGSTRAVYGLGTLYSGSPFVSPGYDGPAGSTLCGYVLHFPDDDAFLGETDFVMDWPIRDTTRQLEQRAYEFAADIGLPYLHRRFVHMYVNSTKRGAVYEDTQQPGSAYLRNWSPGDDDGSLHKIEDWFEFGTGGDREFNDDARLEDFRRSDGSRNTARYRWNFRPRSVQNSAHDFSALFRLVDAAVPPAQLLEFQRDLEREMDVDEWAGIFAVEHAVGNWDSFGYSRGKNMYAYRPESGPWRLFMWDIDFVMSAEGEGPGNWPFATIDGTIAKLYQYPPFQRAYWRAVKKLVNGPMLAERFAARTEAVRQGLIENGLSPGSLTAARNWVRDQRTSLLTQLATADRPFTLETSLANGSTTDPVLRLQGQGPVEMTHLQINGVMVPVSWFLPDRWVAVFTLQNGRNQVAIAPADATGRTLGGLRTLSATLREAPQPDSRRIVINEIHVAPKTPGAEFVELYNPSTSQSFDLSGLQLVGSGTYDFPANASLPPNQFLVIGASIPGFQQDFGRTQIPTALVPWVPDPKGQTLALVRPARGTNPAVTVTAVTYRQDGPWPSVTPGRSLQLRDPSRGEDDRVGDWAVYSPPTNTSPWKEFSVTGLAGGTNLLLYVSSTPPSLGPKDLAGRWVGNLSGFGFDFSVEFLRNAEGVLTGRFYAGDTLPEPDAGASELADVVAGNDGAIRFTWADINGRFTGRIDSGGLRASGSFVFENGSSPFTLVRQLPPGTVLVDDLKLAPEAGDGNLLVNGGFQSPLGAEWQLRGAHQDSVRLESSEGSPGTEPGFALRLIGTIGGNGSPTNAVSQRVDAVVPGTAYRLSGRYQAVQAQGLVIGLEGGPRFTVDLRPRTGGGSDATPGRMNSVAESLDPMPLVWVNEVQPENTDGPRDASGRTEPWLELHNSGVVPASLDGYFLSNDPSTPRKWAFPSGSNIAPGGFLMVWLDGEPGEGTTEAPHAGFRAVPRDGVVVLSRAQGDRMLTVDYLRYFAVPSGASFGHMPEAWVHADDLLPRRTPGLPNGSAAEPDRVWINEWMATNNSSVRDPADLDADDWFELYNPGATAVDLTGWFLTDTTANPSKFRVPAGYKLPPGGFLLVWADEESNQNSPTRPDLHVNFRLAGEGEEIAVYRPDGTQVDHVTFGAQTAGVSQGRRPAGAAGDGFVFFDQPTPGRGNTVIPPVVPNILGVERRADGSLVVRFNSEPGVRYRLRAKDDLSQSNWIPAPDSANAVGAVTDIVWRTDAAPQRFLQVERLP